MMKFLPALLILMMLLTSCAAPSRDGRNLREGDMEPPTEQNAAAVLEGDPQGALDPDRVSVIALLLLTNPIRSDANETFSYFAQQGVAKRTDTNQYCIVYISIPKIGLHVLDQIVNRKAGSWLTGKAAHQG